MSRGTPWRPELLGLALLGPLHLFLQSPVFHRFEPVPLMSFSWGSYAPKSRHWRPAHVVSELVKGVEAIVSVEKIRGTMVGMAGCFISRQNFLWGIFNPCGIIGRFIQVIQCVEKPLLLFSGAASVMGNIHDDPSKAVHLNFMSGHRKSWAK